MFALEFCAMPIVSQNYKPKWGEKDDKYKGKFEDNEFWATKDDANVARVSVAHRPHAILPY
jgi:hypothetical protein